MRKAILIVLLGLASAACSGNSTGQPTPTPTPTPDDPKTRAARAEEKFQNSSGRHGETRTAARNAVADFVKSNLPGWTVKGISSQGDGVFSMDADLERQGQHIVISFDVRKFFAESGDGYWLAVPVNKFRFGRLQALTDADLQKQLQEAQTELEDRKSSDSPDEP
jgi:ABC-type glycerol-3-phosphate transport system substrate-binding protein